MRHLFLFLALTVVSEMSYANGRPINTNKTRIKRVIGGTEVQYGSSPYLAYLLAEVPKAYFWGLLTSIKTASCGASLIDKQWVLTAAHCLYKDNEVISANYWQVKLGDVSKSTSYVGYLKGMMSDVLSKPEWEDYYVNVEALHIHPHYNQKDYFKHDIALMKLAHPVNLNLPLDQKDSILDAITNFNPRIKTQSNIAPKRIGVIEVLPYTMNNLTKHSPTECTLKGWGCRASGGEPSDMAYQIKMNIDPIHTCRTHWGGITDTRLCASAVNKLEDACPGDSGSPLTCVINRLNFQVGITSFRSNILNKNIPVVFTRVSAYASWIIGIITNKKG